MATMTTLRNTTAGPPTTAERKINAEHQLRRNLAITDSTRERVRAKLIDVTLEDSPVKRERPRDREKDEQVDLYWDGDNGSCCQRSEGFRLHLRCLRMIRRCSDQHF